MMQLRRKPDGWWIVGLDDPQCPEAGPYKTAAEARADRAGLLRAARARAKGERYFRRYVTTQIITAHDAPKTRSGQGGP